MSCFAGVSSIQWSVKNTFIEPEPADQGNTNLKKWYYSSDLTHARDSNTRFYVQTFVEKLFAARSRRRFAEAPAASPEVSDHECEDEQENTTQQAVEDGQHPSSGSEAVVEDPSAGSEEETLEERQHMSVSSEVVVAKTSECSQHPSVGSGAVTDEKLDNSQFPSVGSKDHHKGTCSPCAHFWRPSSCSKQSSCEFCHLCPDGEHKRRKQEKIKALRAAEKAERKAQRAALKEQSGRQQSEENAAPPAHRPVLLGSGRDVVKDSVS